MPDLMQISLVLQEKEVGGTDSMGLITHLCQGAEPTCILYDVYGTLHFSRAQFLPNLLRVQLLLCTVSFTSLQLINCYWTFHNQCLCSLLTVSILPTWQSRSALCFSFISPSVPLSQLSNCSGCKYWQGMFHYNHKGFQLLVWSCITTWLWTIFFFQLIKIKSMFRT